MLICRESLRELARASGFRAGESLLARQALQHLRQEGEALIAVVRDDKLYDVRLVAGEKVLEWSCSCSRAADGVFCAHCVATGLAWIRTTEPSSEPKPLPNREEVVKHLAGLSKSDLVRKVMDLADNVLGAFRELALEASMTETAPGRADTKALHNALGHALKHPEKVSWDKDEQYARGIEKVVDQIERLLESGYPGDALPVIEEALRGVEHAMGHLAGEGIGVQALRERLEGMHLTACAAAPPDLEQLAKKLFEWGLTGDWDTFLKAPLDYKDVLGSKGLAEYRRLAEAEWAKHPALKPGEHPRAHVGNRFHISTMMEALARATGTIDEVVAVRSKDLSSAWSYQQVAEVLLDASRPREAIEFAERGLKDFPADYRLRDFLVELYSRNDRTDDARRLAWEDFQKHPGRSAWERLKSRAGESWPSRREKALEVARSTVRVGDASDLVDILISERDVEAAWAEAKARGCNDNLWMQLANAREEAQPAECVQVWYCQLDKALKVSDEHNYRQAISHLRKIKSCLERLGKKSEFAEVLDVVRTKNKHRRKFLELLKNARWR